MNRRSPIVAWRGAAPLVLAAILLVTGCGRIDVATGMQKDTAAAAAGKWDAALDLTAKCVAAEPTNVTALTFHGLCLYENHRLEDAIETLETAASASNDFMPQFYLGWVLCEDRRYADAVVPLRKARDQSKSHPNVIPDVLALLARCALEQNLPDGIGYLQALRRYRAFKDAPELYNALGVMWLYRGDYEAAKQSFRQAMEKDRNSAVILQNLAVLHDSYLHEPAQAMRYYRDCLKASQQSSDRNRLAKIQNRLRQMTKERLEPAREGNQVR